MAANQPQPLFLGPDKGDRRQYGFYAYYRAQAGKNTQKKKVAAYKRYKNLPLAERDQWRRKSTRFQNLPVAAQVPLVVAAVALVGVPGGQGPPGDSAIPRNMNVHVAGNARIAGNAPVDAPDPANEINNLPPLVNVTISLPQRPSSLEPLDLVQPDVLDPIAPPSPGQWFFAKFVGSGTFGEANLWVRVSNRTSRIQDRVIGKDFRFRAAYETQIPPEVGRTREASSWNSAFLPRFRGHGWRDPESWILYLKFYKNGSLEQLLRRYIETAENPDEERKKYFPEIFIWLVFNSLAEACNMLYRRGNEDSNPTAYDAAPNSATAGFIHPDIKPGNIFLDEPAIDWYCAFPLCVLGDFGSMLFDGQTACAGTETFMAPEQIYGVQSMRKFGRIPATTLHSRADDKTMVYQIGMTIYSMTRLTFGWHALGSDEARRAQNEFPFPEGRLRLKRPVEFPELDDLVREELVREVDTNEDILDPPLTSSYADLYSARLTRLMMRCLEFDKASRPSLTELLEEVESALTDHESMQPFEFHSMGVDEVEQLPPFFRLPFDEDQFPINRIVNPAGAEEYQEEGGGEVEDGSGNGNSDSDEK